ncbi:MAG: hypothetical protein K0R66_1183 [Gammaproteobacteria bacterium]|jgi:hypothetical protein|nr:hypothetical protein [Gammaproteobacteria bacterium]
MQGGRSLYEVVMADDLEGVEGLLRTGTKPNARYPEHKNETALHAAVRASNVKIARVLLEAEAGIDKAKASINKKNYNAQTPPELAAVSNEIDLLKLFYEYGVNIRDLYGNILQHHGDDVPALAQHSIGSIEGKEVAREQSIAELEAWLKKKEGSAVGQASNAAGQSPVEPSASLVAASRRSSPAPSDVLPSLPTDAPLFSQASQPAAPNPYIVSIVSTAVPMASGILASALPAASPEPAPAERLARQPSPAESYFPLAQETPGGASAATMAVSITVNPGAAAGLPVPQFDIASPVANAAPVQVESMPRMTGRKRNKPESDSEGAISAPADIESTAIRRLRERGTKKVRLEGAGPKP